MGQAKKRGTREDRIAQAQARERIQGQSSTKTKVAQNLSPQEILKKADRLFSNLTTPTEINQQILHFAKMLSDRLPIFLDCQPEPWSRQSCCEGNVTRYMEDHGGEMLCGYRIWYNDPIYIEGERHAVWTNEITTRDVSFSDSGETKILFVPDHLKFDDAPIKVRYAFDELDRTILSLFEEFERKIPRQRLSPQEAWDTMPTYESWLAGVRMPNTWLASKKR